jgi:hypothetical protein
MTNEAAEERTTGAAGEFAPGEDAPPDDTLAAGESDPAPTSAAGPERDTVADAADGEGVDDTRESAERSTPPEDDRTASTDPRRTEGAESTSADSQEIDEGTGGTASDGGTDPDRRDGTDSRAEEATGEAAGREESPGDTSENPGERPAAVETDDAVTREEDGRIEGVAAAETSAEGELHSRPDRDAGSGTGPPSSVGGRIRNFLGL